VPFRFATLRPFVLPIVLIPALLLAIFAAALFLRHGNVPASLVRVLTGVARDAGADLQIGSLRVGWFQQDCRAGLDASGVHLGLPALDNLQIDINALHACATPPSFLQGVRVHADAGARLQIGAVEVSAKNTAARDVQVTTAANSTVTVREASMAQPVFSKQSGALAIESIEAAGVDVRLAAAPAPDVCEQTHTMLAAAEPLIDAAGASLARLDRLAARVHRDLIYTALLLTAALILLKVGATAWTDRWPLRLALGAAAVVVPLLVYALTGPQALPTLVLFALAASALAGGFMYFMVYRHGPRRYERWEPLAVDLACSFIVLPLAGVSLTAIAPRAPSSVTIARVAVTDVTVNGAADRCGQPQTFSAAMKSARIDAIAAGLPAPTRDDTVLSIAAVQIPGLSAAVRDGSKAGDDTVRIQDAQIRADQIKVTVDWKDAQVREIVARLHAHASAESPALTDQLRQVRALAPIVGGLGSTDVDVDVQAAGAASTATGDLDRFDAVNNDQTAIAIRARLAINPRQCTLTYATAMRILTPQARLIATGAGNLSRADVRTIRSLPGSALNVERGSGTLSLTGQPGARVTLAGLGIARGAARLRVASADLSASAAPSCSPVNQTIAVAIAGADVDSGNGARVRIARTDARFSQRETSGRHAVSLGTRLEDVRFIVRPGGDGAEIAGSVPSLQVTGNGTTTGEPIPRRVDGALDASITTADGELRTTTPLRFRADVWNGAIGVPEQNESLRQSIVSALPADLAFSISADARLPTTTTANDGRLSARVRVPRMAIQSGPLRAEVRDLDVTAGAGRLVYGSGWSSLTTPPAPKAFCLEEVPRLDLSADGDAKGVAPPRDLFAGGAPSTQPCLALPNVAAEQRFKVDGVWPGIRLQGPSGAGIEIRTIDSRIQRADLTGGRLHALELDTNLSGIRTLDGGGDLRIETHTAIAETATRVSSSLFGANRASLADLTLDASPGRVVLAATPRARTEDAVAAVTPFLSAAGVSLDGVTPKARVNSVTAELRFDGPTITRVTARLEVAPGPLASIAFAPGRSPEALRSLDLAIAESAPVAVFQVSLERAPNSERASVALSTDVSRVSAHAVDGNGADIQTSLDLHADVRGALHDAVQPAHPVGTLLTKTAGDLARHGNNAARVFWPPASAARAPVDASWNVRLRNATANQPVLKIDRDAIGLDLAIGPATISVRRTGDPERSALSASGQLSAGLTVHDGQLVLDAYAPLRLDASLPAQPARTIDGDLALLVAFSDALRPAPETGNGLWNAEYYAGFWSGYTVTRASRARAPLIDSPRVVAGPISVRQIASPLAPAPIDVGTGERLELHAPFTGSALFGTANGLFESAVGWGEDRALLDSRFTLTLGNIQAGAMGLDIDDAHVPLIEDELDVDLTARSDGLPLTRDAIARAAAFETPAGLDRISLALQMHKSARSQAVPGVLQLSIGTQLDTLNRILNTIVRDLQMRAPPQTMLYRSIDVDVRVDRGRVATDTPWVTLDGVRIFSDSHLALDGTVRLHGGRNGDSLTLDDLLALFIPQ